MAKGRLYFSPNLFAQNTAVGIPIVSAIPRKEISSTEFFLCIQKLMAESIPLMAVVATKEGLSSKLYGFVDSATRAIGLVFFG